MTAEIISRSISIKAWDWTEIKLAIPGSAVRLTNDCAMETGRPRIVIYDLVTFAWVKVQNFQSLELSKFQS